MLSINKIKSIIDISRVINANMAVWPGDEHVAINKISSIENGDLYNLSSINIGLHTGTHIDAPLHFIKNKNDTSSVDLNLFIGKAKVIEIKNNGFFITEAELKDKDIIKDDIIILKTKNSEYKEDGHFYKEYVSINLSAALYLVGKGIKSIGIDYLSIESYDTEEGEVHKTLLSNGIGIVEGLNLKHVVPGEYFFISLPLKIKDGDGSPVRAVLLEM